LQADVDDSTPHGTDSEAGTSPAPIRRARAKVLGNLNKIAERLPSPSDDGFMTFQETEDEIVHLVERLHDIRQSSRPEIFERLWQAHIGRVEEIEAHAEPYEITPIGPRVDKEGTQVVVPASDASYDHSGEDVIMGDDNNAPTNGLSAAELALQSQTDRFRGILNGTPDVHSPARKVLEPAMRIEMSSSLSTEPFNTSGNPVPTSWIHNHRLPPTLPEQMSIWIMTSPPYVPYSDRAYLHPSAPVRVQDGVFFFRQVVERAGTLREQDVKGYAFSYGWNDITRWIEKTVGQGCRGAGDGKRAGESEGERVGWEVFQRDLREAARAGVMVWRMKVLVVKE
jgi:hypothetical protein